MQNNSAATKNAIFKSQRLNLTVAPKKPSYSQELASVMTLVFAES